MNTLQDARIGAGLIYLTVMAKLNAGKYKRNIVLNVLTTVGFVVGWMIISHNLQKQIGRNSIEDTFQINNAFIFSTQVAISLIIVGTSINRILLDYGSKKLSNYAIVLVLLGWITFNVLFYLNNQVSQEDKIQMIVGSVIVLLGTWMNRRGELRKMNKAFGAVVLLIGWAVVSDIFKPLSSSFN